MFYQNYFVDAFLNKWQSDEKQNEMRTDNEMFPREEIVLHLSCPVIGVSPLPVEEGFLSSEQHAKCFFST